jgi:hypothetical protein
MAVVLRSEALWIHVRRHPQDAEALLGPVNEGLVPTAIGVARNPAPAANASRGRHAENLLT